MVGHNSFFKWTLHFNYFSPPTFEKKRRASSNSTMAKRASRGGGPWPIPMLGAWRLTSTHPVPCQSCFNSSPAATKVRHLHKFVPTGSRLWVWRSGSLLFLFLFLFYIFFPKIDFLEPWLRIRENTRNSSPQNRSPLGLWYDREVRLPETRRTLHWSTQPLIHDGMLPGKYTSLAFSRPQYNTGCELKQQPPLLKYMWHNKTRGSP